MGELFVKHGVKHVICVKQQQEVLDQAALLFTKFFYTDIFNEKTVCEAFQAAKKHVEFLLKTNESELFILLPTVKHQKCYSIKKDEGVLQCESAHLQVKKFPKFMKQRLMCRE